jgi:hypothetical protein
MDPKSCWFESVCMYETKYNRKKKEGKKITGERESGKISISG